MFSFIPDIFKKIVSIIFKILLIVLALALIKFLFQRASYTIDWDELYYVGVTLVGFWMLAEFFR